MLPPPVPLVDLLREELAGYGGLLACFDDQQQRLLRGEPDSVAEASAAIESLVAETATHRATREAWARTFAAAHGRPAESTLRQLLPLFPLDQQPLLAALIDEINHLIYRVRHRARQNHLLLARAVELHRETIEFIRPGTRTRTYAPTGRVATSPASTLRAAG